MEAPSAGASEPGSAADTTTGASARGTGGVATGGERGVVGDVTAAGHAARGGVEGGCGAGGEARSLRSGNATAGVPGCSAARMAAGGDDDGCGAAAAGGAEADVGEEAG